MRLLVILFVFVALPAFAGNPARSVGHYSPMLSWNTHGTSDPIAFAIQEHPGGALVLYWAHGRIPQWTELLTFYDFGVVLEALFPTPKGQRP